MSRSTDDQIAAVMTAIDHVTPEAPALHIRELPLRRLPGRLPGPAVAVAAAAVVIIAIGIVVAIRLHAPTPPPVVTTPTTAFVPATAGQADQVNDLAIAPDGHLWAATMAGVVRWDPATSTSTVFSEADGLVDRRVEHIDVAPDGTVWVLGTSWVARFDGTWTVVARNLPTPIGDIAAGPDDTAWVAAGLDSLIHIDDQGTTTVEVPQEGLSYNPFISLAVDAEGTVWATVYVHEEQFVRRGGGILAFDGEWHHYGVNDGLPGPMTSNVVVAPDGSVWVGDELYGDMPAAGIARFDGTTWTSFTAADGLLSNDGGVAVGLDGDVWVIHTGLPAEYADALDVHLPSGLSHYDGTRWDTFPDVPTGSGRGAAVSADGTLWMPSQDGIVGFDGAESSRLIAGTEAVPPLPPAGEPISLELAETLDPLPTSIGTIQFTTWRLPQAWQEVFRITATAHGVVGVTDPDAQLVWSNDGITWSEVPVSVEPYGFTSDGDDLFAYNDTGAVRLTWNGTQWVETARLGIDGASQVVVGSQGIVATHGTQVYYYSSDGTEFRAAERPPRREALQDVASPGCSPGASSGSLTAELGPLAATNDGFIILTPRRASDWTETPTCEPLVWFSGDGNTWELVSEESPFGPHAFVYGIATRDGRLAAAGGVGELGAVWVSDDGLTWESTDVQLAYAEKIAAGARGWILLGVDPTSPTFSQLWQMWFSTDGTSWDGPYERPEGWRGSYVEPDAVVLDDRIIGSGWGQIPDPDALPFLVVVGEFLDD